MAVKDIADVIIVHSDGSQEALGLGGYLDIGLIDTMKDLMVNFLGAVVFSIIGYFYVKEKGKGDFAAQFIPRVARAEGRGVNGADHHKRHRAAACRLPRKRPHAHAVFPTLGAD